MSQALTSAWKKACASARPSKVLIPKGIFSLSPVTLEGPCKAAIEVQVQGTLKALSGAGKTTEDGGWVTFQRIEGFTLSGGGIFDGQGTSSWGACGNDYCKQLPIVSLLSNCIYPAKLIKECVIRIGTDKTCFNPVHRI